jgi:hypothetical protein
MKITHRPAALCIAAAMSLLASCGGSDAQLGSGCSMGTGRFAGHAIQPAYPRNAFVLLTQNARHGVMLLLSPN